MKPYLTLVAASRNDNHGKDMDKRQRMFVRGLIHQANKYKLPIELIIVEWNPPANAPLLRDVMPQPKEGDYLSLRYVVVPNHIHQTYRFASEMALYQMIAKNVGIRRATADFVLCTNVDLLFSDALVEQLAKRNLDAKYFYRANRCDIKSTIEESRAFEKQLEFAHQNVIRRLGKDSEHLYLNNWPAWIYRYRWLSKRCNTLVRLLKKRSAPPVVFEINNLDTNACGDFTLMHKSVWEDIQGYPELDLYSIHIDSMGLIAARALGYGQCIFPTTAVTYHIDHENGWEALSALQRLIFVHKRPGIGWDILYDAAKQLIQEKARFNTNKPDWGFAKEQFEEFNFNKFE